MVHGVLKDELTAFAAAQSGKEQEYLQAKEAADVAARLAMSKASEDSGQQYQYLDAQVSCEHRLVRVCARRTECHEVRLFFCQILQG